MSKEDDTTRPGEPFPLKRNFQRRILPGLLLFAAVLTGLAAFAGDRVARGIYLELAQRRAETIARAVESEAPEGWAALMAGKTAADLADTDLGEALAEAFSDEREELDLPELKVYDLTRKVLYATDADEIGEREDGDALVRVIEGGRSAIEEKALPDGGRLYEFYVPLNDETGRVKAVFELYEPVGHLNAILVRAAVPLAFVSGALLLALTFALFHLVRRAQADIDARTRALDELRLRLETFVSASAAAAARNADIPSRKMVATLFFSDIRSFTSFAESTPPEDVVDYLNAIMGVQVDAVARHRGDVDKMIGDAVLARFDGDDGPARAIACARDILAKVDRMDPPRRIGVGIYRGEVISGAIGPKARRDFTVIGDSVNTAARLCSDAKADEIVAAAALADDGFDPEETIMVKGRGDPLTIRRWRLPG